MKAAIFDFDGLILDTEKADVESWQAVFAQFGADYPETYWRFALGRGAEQIQESPYDLLRAHGVALSDAEIFAMREAIHLPMLLALEVLPGVLERIVEARSLGWKLGVASSSKHAWVDGHLDRLDLRKCFDAIVCADDVARAKPFPDLYLECCRRLGVVPMEAIALEDSVNGCRAARDAGLFVVGRPTALTDPTDLEAHRVVRSLTDVSFEELERVLPRSPQFFPRT